VLYGLTAPLAWLPGLGELHVVVTYADQQQPSAGLRLCRDEAAILLKWHPRQGHSRRAR
jgi:hypothetical protein